MWTTGIACVLVAGSGGTGDLAELRRDDDPHEFISYPVFQETDENHTLLKREGYAAFFDSAHGVSRWVSQHVTREWLMDEAVQDDGALWTPDPELEDSVATSADYASSGYSRGHLAMQATLRGRSEACEREGYYYANVAPQYMNFNGGGWLSLEEKVLEWVDDFGEVWVSTGPVFGERVRKLNGRISIPVGFFKIVARKTSNDSVRVITFFLLNRQYSAQKIEACVTSIDTIEDLTGLDFFADLPDEVEEKLEASTEDLGFGAGVIPTARSRSGNQVRGPPQDEPQPDITVYVTRTGKKYHRGSCRYLRKSRIPMSLQEAKRRFGRCSVCKPPS